MQRIDLRRSQSKGTAQVAPEQLHETNIAFEMDNTRESRPKSLDPRIAQHPGVAPTQLLSPIVAKFVKLNESTTPPPPAASRLRYQEGRSTRKS